jgi:TrmH family RNA methyltransferase
MITSPDNDRLRTIRKLQQKRWRRKLGLFVAEGEDLVAAAEEAGWAPEFLLRAGRDVEPELLAEVSALGSGSRVIGVYRQRWSEPRGRISVYLHRVEDPGNVGTVMRSAHALADGPVILGPGCADPFSLKAARASMGSVFARPPAQAAGPEELEGQLLPLDAHASTTLREAALEAPIVICLGAERAGLPAGLTAQAVRIPVATDSLNAAMAATVALYEVANRMAGHA